MPRIKRHSAVWAERFNGEGVSVRGIVCAGARFRGALSVRPKVVVAAVVALSVAGVGACGSSSSGSPSNSSSQAVSSSTGAAGSDPGVARAEAALAGYLKAPTSIGKSTPFPSAPPKGKTFVWLSCDIDVCADISKGAQAAVAALGWQFKSVPFQLANPASLISAMNTALQYHPIAVGFTGLGEATWASMKPVFAAAHVTLISSGVGPVQPGPSIGGEIATQEDSRLQGQILADWFISDSKGHGHALLVDVPSLPPLTAVGEGFKAELAQNCPSCSATTIKLSVVQYGTDGGVPAVVSALQKDSSVKYVITEGSGSDQGLPSALSGAGLSNIKIAGGFSSATAIGYLRNGSAAAFIHVPQQVLGWMMLNIAALNSLGIKPATSGRVPLQLVTDSTVTPTTFTEGLPKDYEAQYKALWHVG
jgi:ribose transport system substrate-binding protein